MLDKLGLSMCSLFSDVKMHQPAMMHCATWQLQYMGTPLSYFPVSAFICALEKLQFYHIMCLYLHTLATEPWLLLFGVCMMHPVFITHVKWYDTDTVADMWFSSQYRYGPKKSIMISVVHSVQHFYIVGYNEHYNLEWPLAGFYPFCHLFQFAHFVFSL